MALNKRIDFSKKAKPTGLRFKGSHEKLKSKYYKRPERVLSEKGLEKAKHDGLVYYDPRLTKGDMRQTDKFAQGGILDWAWLNQKLTLSELFSK